MTLFADIPGERLDAFLARSVEGLSRSAAQKLIENALVLRNGKPERSLRMGLSPETESPERKTIN